MVFEISDYTNAEHSYSLQRQRNQFPKLIIDPPLFS